MRANNSQASYVWSPHVLALLLTLSQLICLASSWGPTCNPRDMTISKPNKGPSCPQEEFSGQGISQDEKDLIVKTHNEFRLKLASGDLYNDNFGRYFPKAGNMRRMNWSPELARIAQRHAQQCIYEHDQASCRSLGGKPTGQNIGYQWSSSNITTPDWQDRLKAWWNEYEDYNPQNIAPVDTSDTSLLHFTQIAWADTKLIGCGFAAYSKREYIDGRWYNGITRLYVCNYSPQGNIMRTQIYQIGERDSCRPNDGYLPPCRSGVAGTRLQSLGTLTPSSATAPRRPRGSALRRRRGSVSRRQQGFATRRRRGSASRRRRGPASRRRRGPASRRQQGSASRRQQGPASRRRRGSASRRQQGSASRKPQMPPTDQA